MQVSVKKCKFAREMYKILKANNNQNQITMKQFKLFLTFLISLMMGTNALAADLVIDEYMSTFNGQYSYNVLMTNEDVWHWTTATTPIDDSSASYPSWGGSSSLYPFAVTSNESVTEGSVLITLDCSFKRYYSYYPKCRVEVLVGGKKLYCQYAKDERYYYDYADIETSDSNPVDKMLTFVSFGEVSGEVVVRVNNYSVSGALNGTFSLRSVNVKRAKLVPPTVESDQPNPAEAPFTLTVTNNDPDAELYWTYSQSNPFSGGSTPAAITSGFTKTYDNNYQNSFYAYTKRDGFYSAFVGGIYEKKVVRNIQFSEESGHYFLSNTLPPSVTITCDDLKDGDQLLYKKGLDTDWTAISSPTTINISAQDADNYNNYYKVALYAKVVNASGMESEVKNLYLPIVSWVPDVAFNGWSNSNNKYELEFNGPQLLTLSYSSYPVEGLALEYSYDGENWYRYNATDRPVISSTKMVYGRVVYSSNGDVAYTGCHMNYIINSARLSGTCAYNYYSDMPFDITIGSTSFVNTYVAYTTDGSDPRTSTTAKQVNDEEQTVHIAESCTLKMAINQAGAWNDVVEKTMSIQLNQPFSFKQPQYVPDYNDNRSLDATYWLHNEVGLSCSYSPYYSVDYDNGNVGSWSVSSTNCGFFSVKSGLGECTYTVTGDVNDNRYITHMVVTSLESWNAHDNIDFNGQTVFTTYEANGSSLRTDANGQKYLLVPQGATITVSAPEGINLLGVFLNGGNSEENISHLRQTVEGCYVSHVPVNDWYCKWIGRRHSVTFVADEEQHIYGIESFYYLTPSDINVYFDNDEITVGETMPAPNVYNPNNLPITYSSSDTDIATVDAETGVVTAIAPGWCTISAEFAGDGVYAPFKEDYQIHVLPDVSTINFMGQELKNQESTSGEVGNGTWTFTWEEEEVQEYGGGEYFEAPRRSAPRRNVNGTTIVQIPVLTLNNVTITSENPILEVNDYSEFRLRLIGENSLTSTQAPAILLGTYNGEYSRGASMLITDEDGVWETEIGGGYNPGVAAPRHQGRRKANGTNGPAKLTISGGPVGIRVCNGSLFIADCEVEASGTGYGVYFMDYYEPEGGISSGEANAPRREAPKKVLPTSDWAYYFQINDNAKLKLQGGEAALYGWFCGRDLNVNITPELKACDLSLDDVQFNSYWDDGYYFYSYMVYDNASNAYNYAKSLQFYNDYFTVNTIEGVKMRLWPLDEDEMTCQVGYYDGNSSPLIAIDRYTSGSVTIPSEANGYTVTNISGGAFYDCNYISSVSIPASVESIGEMAFGDCYILKQVTCLATTPPELDIIQEEGEAPMTPFTEIDKGAILYVPAESMTAYENSEWSNCFCEIRPIGGDDFIFAAKTKEGVTMTFQVLDADEKTAQVYGCYYYNNSDFGPAVSQSTQGTVTVPAQVLCSDNDETYSIIGISDRAFGGCSNLTSVVLSEGIQYIGYGAFYNCYRMTSLVIPSSVNYIDDYALQYCENLESVTIYVEDPDDVDLTGVAFYDMNCYPTLYVPAGTKASYVDSYWAQYFGYGERIVEMEDNSVYFTVNVNGVDMTFKVTGENTVQTYGYYYWDNNDNFVAVPAIPLNSTGVITIPETVAAAAAKTQEDKPNATFTATGADCGTLTNVTTAMRYSVSGADTWLAVTGDPMEIAGVTTEYGVKVYLPATDENTKLDSDVQSIAVTRAATPNLAARQPDVIGGTGSIPTTSAYQKSTDGTNWESCTGANGIDKSVIQACFDGEGRQLLAEDFKLANKLNIGGSPTWVANGKHQFSGLDAETARANFCKHNSGLAGCANKLSGDSGAPVQGGCGN